MIIEADTTEVVTNIEGAESRPMFISEEGLAHIMTTLTNLYNDPETAVIREYTANGIDAHVMAGNPAPVEVTLPTYDNCMFVVQDYGVGMSRDEIWNIYAGYGESTKRETNGQIGAFGFGCKSGLAIANQFTLSSVKDGKKTSALVQKAPDGLNKVFIVSVIDTDEPNGVKVTVPVAHHQRYAFNQKARKFFQFAAPGTVLVDDVEPTSVFENAKLLNDPANPDFSAYFRPDIRGDYYVVMGNVPYMVAEQEVRDSLARLGIETTERIYNAEVYFPVPIGSVKLTPNREGLRFTDQTRDYIDTLLKSFVSVITVEAQAEINAITDRAEVPAVVQRWEDSIGLRFQWNGEDVPKTIRVDEYFAEIDRGSNAHNQKKQFNPFKRSGTTIVSGRAHDKYKRISGYITDYIEVNGLNSSHRFLFTEDTTELQANPWLSENSLIRFDDFDAMMEQVRAFRKERRAKLNEGKPAAPRKPSNTYSVLDPDTGFADLITASEIPADTYYLAEDELLWNSGVESVFKHGRMSGLAKFLTEYTEVESVVLLPKRRKLETFAKKFPEARNLREVLASVYESFASLRTPEIDEYNYHENNWSSPVYEIENAGAILDPDVREPITAIKDLAVAETAKKISEYWKIARHFVFRDSVFPSLDSYDNGSSRREELWEQHNRWLARYPLLRNAFDYGTKSNHEHVVLYMNAVYSTLVNSTAE